MEQLWFRRSFRASCWKPHSVRNLEAWLEVNPERQPWNLYRELGERVSWVNTAALRCWRSVTQLLIQSQLQQIKISSAIFAFSPLVAPLVSDGVTAIWVYKQQCRRLQQQQLTQVGLWSWSVVANLVENGRTEQLHCFKRALCQIKTAKNEVSGEQLSRPLQLCCTRGRLLAWTRRRRRSFVRHIIYQLP